MTLADDLKAVRQLLVDKGRCQGDFMDLRDSPCLLAAVYEVSPLDELNYRSEPIYVALAAHLPSPFKRLTDFNDHPDTTDQGVLDLIDKALANLGAI